MLLSPPTPNIFAVQGICVCLCVCVICLSLPASTGASVNVCVTTCVHDRSRICSLRPSSRDLGSDERLETRPINSPRQTRTSATKACQIGGGKWRSLAPWESERFAEIPGHCDLSFVSFYTSAVRPRRSGPATDWRCFPTSKSAKSSPVLSCSQPQINVCFRYSYPLWPDPFPLHFFFPSLEQIFPLSFFRSLL